MRKKRPITLLEIMVVILLIGIITSVVGYNVKGSLEKGKVFKTKQAKMQIVDLLTLEMAKGSNMDDVVKNPQKYLKNSGMAKDVDKLLVDGWGDPLEVTQKNGKIVVYSKNLDKYKKDHGIEKTTDDEQYY